MKSYRIEIKPNNKQLQLLKKSCNVSRYTYNWMLGKKIDEYEALKSLAKMYDLDKVPNIHGTYVEWSREWTLFKKDKDWIKEVSKCCGQEALRNLEMSFKRFFKGLSKHPKFKRKGINESFRLNGFVFIDYNKIQLPVIGKVRLKEKGYATDKKIKISSVTVSREVDRWFVSFFIKDKIVVPKLQELSNCAVNDILGIDLGIKTFAVLSDGTQIENPKNLKRSLKRLKQRQRALSRKKKGSNNRNKARIKLASIHEKVTNQRLDFLHKTTAEIVQSYDTICLETLTASNMMKNHKLAQALSDIAIGKFNELLEYKAEWYGKNILRIGRFEPSSRLCTCGVINKELKLSHRTWTCNNCGATHDRDVLASNNIKRMAFHSQNKIRVERSEFTLGSYESQ